MKAIKLIAACALLSLTGAASAQDRWNGPDKPKHIAVSAFSAVVVESVFADSLTPLQRVGLAMVPGVAKELFDMRKGGSGFSGKDLVADALGVGFGMAGYHVIVRPGYVGINVKF